MERGYGCKKYKIIYISIYVFMTVFGGTILTVGGNDFVTNNLVFFVYIIIFLFAIFLFWREIISAIKNVKIKQFDQLCCIGTFTIILEVLFSMILYYFIRAENLNQINIDAQKVSANLVLWEIAVMIIAPISEEFFYRYCMIDLFSRHKMIGNFFSVFLFSFMHVWEYLVFDRAYTQLFSMLPYIALGMGLVILYNKTQNLVFPILLHVFINTISELA